MLAHHPDPTVDHVLKTWAPRMIVQGIDYNDSCNDRPAHSGVGRLVPRVVRDRRRARGVRVTGRG